MVDTAKNIWNDDDGTGEAPKKWHLLRRLLLFALVLLVVLGVVLAASWRGGTGWDALQRYFNYGKSGVASGTTVYEYDVSSQNRFAMLGDRLAVASDTGVRLLDPAGKEVWGQTADLSVPALAQGGDRAVVYGVGGYALYLLDQSGELLHLTAGEEEPFLAATLNENGWLAVTAEKSGYKGSVSVYDSAQKLVFQLNSASRFVLDAYVTDDNETLAAVLLGQEEGEFVSSVVLYPLSAESGTANGEGVSVEPAADYSVKDGLVMTIGQQGNRIVTVSDTCLTLADLKGSVTEEVSFGGKFLRGQTLDGEGFTALLLNQYQSGSVGRLVTLDEDGQELGALEVNREVLDLSAAGRYLAVLYADSLVIYNPQLEVYASLQGTDLATGVLMRPDGSALLLSTGSAGLFLP